MIGRIAFWGPRSRLGFLVALLAFVVDQGHKWWMLEVFQIAERRLVAVTPFFDLVLVWNKGVSYGLFQQNTETGLYLLLAFTVAAVLFLIGWMAVCGSSLVACALGLIVGGALGNGTDRIVHGAVADFFSFHAYGFHWYVFNLADVAIVAGVAILLYDSVQDWRRAGRIGDSQG